MIKCILNVSGLRHGRKSVLKLLRYSVYTVTGVELDKASVVIYKGYNGIRSTRAITSCDYFYHTGTAIIYHLFRVLTGFAKLTNYLKAGV